MSKFERVCTQCKDKKTFKQKPKSDVCRKCHMKEFNNSKRIGKQEIARRANEKGLEILGTFETTRDTTLFSCLECSHQWKANVNNVVSRSKGCPKCTILKGDLHPNWDESKTDKYREYRRNHEFKVWSKAIKEVAEYTCDCYNVVGGYLESHHLESYAVNKDKRYDISNGVCLCRNCHYNFHQEYGYFNSTKEQYITFKGVYNG